MGCEYRKISKYAKNYAKIVLLASYFDLEVSNVYFEVKTGKSSGNS
jgi:hypothetical protein